MAIAWRLMLLVTVSAEPERLLTESDASPVHAGCFITNGPKMLVIKLTYDGNKFDIPGGQTDWREPAMRTAERETWEESGYRVSIGQLLATVRNGFRIYRCYLQQQEPGKKPDHEVSSVQWISASEVENYISQHLWRFQEDQAHLYLSWLNKFEGNRRLLIV